MTAQPEPGTYEGLCTRQVQWYRQFGKYPSLRIVKDRRGIEYVVGDWSWQRKHPGKREIIDAMMQEAS